MVGGSAPVRALIEAIGHACAEVINVQHKSWLSLPSCCIIKGSSKDSSTLLVVGADDSVLEAAIASKLPIYGAYQNLVSANGVSAMFAGIISPYSSSSSPSTPSSSASFSSRNPLVIAGGQSAISLNPDNMVHSAKTIVFYEKGAKKANLTSEQATERLFKLAGSDSKADLIKEILNGTKSVLVGSAAEALGDI